MSQLVCVPTLWWVPLCQNMLSMSSRVGMPVMMNWRAMMSRAKKGQVKLMS